MKRMTEALRRQGTRLVSIGLIGAVLVLSRQPGLSPAQAHDLGQRFQFREFSMPELAGQPYRSIREVNPSLERISAWISSVGAGIALHDLDRDGLPNDFCQVEVRTNQVLVGPVPGTPERYQPFALDPAPLAFDRTMAPMGCVPGDLNEDGRADLLVYYWGRSPIGFLRQGDTLTAGAAAYKPVELVPGGERWFTNAATRADLDGDGHLDIVVGNYFADGARILDVQSDEAQQMQRSMSRAFNAGDTHFLLWAEGTGGAEPSVRFSQAKVDLPYEVTHGWTLGLGAADLDGDLLPELYLANDFGPDRLLHNRSTPGQLRFALLEGQETFFTPSSHRLGHDSFKGMGVEFADINGDGYLDIYVSNISNSYGLVESHFVWINTGKTELMKKGIAPFVNGSVELGLALSGWGWDVKTGDFDNDGTLEAIQATGFVQGQVNRWPELQELATGNDTLLDKPFAWPRVQAGDDLSGTNTTAFFVRGADGRYRDLGPTVGLQQPRMTRGAATADVDGDGDLDFALAAQWAPSSFYRNECAPCGAYLGLHLLLPVGTAEAPLRIQQGHPGPDLTGRPAVGATVEVKLPDGSRRTAQVDGGNGHSGKRAPDIFFGLGSLAAGTPLEMTIRWRDAAGQARTVTRTLTPGWHTVRLGAPEEE